MFAAGYRSLRSIRFPVDRLAVFAGANGVGKTNLYRSLQLLQAAARGDFSDELAGEGGMASAMWAGTRRVGQPARIRLAVGFGHAGEPVFTYEIEAGLTPPVAPEAFPHEPLVKEETLTLHDGARQTRLLERRGPAVFARDAEGRRITMETDLLGSETALGTFDEPGSFPELHLVRRRLRDWRFYHEIRTDAGAPLRQPCRAVSSPTLASDAGNLAAVFATLKHIRKDTADLDAVVADAFPRARLVVPLPERTASFGLIFPDHPRRAFEASELSDGTLRYLALVGALMALRLPALIALNEPEASLHPSLLEPLARLIVRAAQRTQVWLVTHSAILADALARHGGITPRSVFKKSGETWIEGLSLLGRYAEPD